MLLSGDRLPRFDRFDPSLVSPALDVLLADARAALKLATAPQTPADWDHVVEPLDIACERLSSAWGIVGHLSGVADTDALRQAYNENLPRVTQFWTELGQSTELFARYQLMRDSAGFASLTPARQRIVDNALRDFRLGGADLVSPHRERYGEIQERQAALRQKFSENLLDSTRAFAICLSNRDRLSGLPEDVIEAAAADAAAHEADGYRLTLQFPCYVPVMQYADDRDLREQMYRAFVTAASELAVAPADDPARRGELNNTPLIAELLKLRDEEAQMLGYATYAEVSLASKMAESPAQVIQFLTDLAVKARPAAERDLIKRDAFARSLGLDTVQAWDAAWVSEKLRHSEFDFSDQQVKQYFQLPNILQALFAQAEKLFGVSIAADETVGWHDSVQFFRIERGGELLGHFYTDFFSRSSKRQGAWMNGARSRALRNGAIQTPIAYLVCNFQSPVGGKPALLTHGDVITLFHEFGHGLHHLLTRVDDLSVSGIAGVEWDAVELPSQFMENFCWEWDIVRAMSAHIDTGEPLAKDLFDKMYAARNFQSGLQTLRQIEFSLFDMQIHTDRMRSGEESVQQVFDDVRSQVAVVPTPDFNRFQNSFSHIFAGGYAAGYYSYKWAEVLSADAYAAFEEAAEQSDSQAALLETGVKFLDEILAVGGSRPAIDSFRAFRGRDPEIAALLRHNGMDETV
ncbi:MAG: M3 family metallopeptidase [Burkholderiaceae bacterium]